MKSKILIFLSILLSSCTCTYQYNVLVKNNCSQNLTVHYKSVNDKSGTITDTITVIPGGLKNIISTVNLEFESGCEGLNPEHCTKAAEYVSAFIDDSIPSNISWCDKSIKFIKSDIQQGEFVITYHEKNFNL